MRKEDKWIEECIETGEAKRIQKIEQKKELISKKNFNSQYWLRAAENILDSDTPKAAIVLGYYAAQAKAEEALAYKNIKPESHGCTYKGVSRVLEEKRLGNQLRKAYRERKNVNYEANLGENSEEPQQFIENRIKPLIHDLEEKIEEIRE